MDIPPKPSLEKPRSHLWRRWGWRLLIAVPAFVLLVWVGDYFYFRATVPVTFYDANWSGHWQTDYVGVFRGRLLVKLPDPMPENEPFHAQALVYYPIYSVYRTGRFIPMDFAAEYSPESGTASGAADLRTADRANLGGGKLKFKGTAGKQVVDYVAIFSKDGDRIIGSYEAQNPYDYGHFMIEK